MMIYPPAVQAAIANRQGLMVRNLLWLSARNRDTGAVETMGLWDGDDHQSITVGAEVRTYYGAGAMLGLPDLTFEAGITVRMQDLRVSGISPEVEVALRGYDPKGGAVELHRWFLDPDSGNALAPPMRIYRGFIDRVSIPTSAIGGEAVATITLASAARALTRTLPLKRSLEASKLRGGDGFYRFSDVTGPVKVKLGAGK